MEILRVEAFDHDLGYLLILFLPFFPDFLIIIICEILFHSAHFCSFFLQSGGLQSLFINGNLKVFER